MEKILWISDSDLKQMGIFKRTMVDGIFITHIFSIHVSVFIPRVWRTKLSVYKIGLGNACFISIKYP